MFNIVYIAIVTISELIRVVVFMLAVLLNGIVTRVLLVFTAYGMQAAHAEHPVENCRIR